MKMLCRLLVCTLLAFSLLESLPFLAPEVPGTSSCQAAPAPLSRKQKPRPMPNLAGEWAWDWYGSEWHVKLGADGTYEATSGGCAWRFEGTWKLEWKGDELTLTIREYNTSTPIKHRAYLISILTWKGGLLEFSCNDRLILKRWMGGGA